MKRMFVFYYYYQCSLHVIDRDLFSFYIYVLISFLVSTNFVIETRPNSSVIPDVANGSLIFLVNSISMMTSIVFTAAVVSTSKANVEDSSVGRQLSASRHHELSMASNDAERNALKQMELIRFTCKYDVHWHIQCQMNSIYVELPEQFCVESKEKYVDYIP
jgi:hypothetical protein